MIKADVLAVDAVGADIRRCRTARRVAGPIGSVFSPDGRGMAYSSATTTTARRGLSPKGGVHPRFQPRVPIIDPEAHARLPSGGGPKGAELFTAASASGQLSGERTTQPSVCSRHRESDGEAPRAGCRARRGRTTFDDGRFIGMVAPSEPDSSAPQFSGQMRVVLNWFEEVKQRAPR